MVAACGALPLFSQEWPEPTAKGIQDNSFLIEEAYNQEPGIVQHILNIRRDINKLVGPDDREWQFVFTQEWPLFSQTHQLSYTIPYSLLESGGQSVNGVGDVMLNYRIQALYESDTRPAFAPRFSLVLPTGDESKGLGDDTLGYQFNLPFSKIVHDRWTLHANAGLTLLPDLNDRNPVNYNLGASAIYAVTPNFNLMLESIGEWVETVDSSHRIKRDLEAIILPGARCAFNLSAGQLVLGVGAPIGLTKAAPDYGVIFYLSFEHRFQRAK
jgi:hypothetical protein